MPRRGPPPRVTPGGTIPIPYDGTLRASLTLVWSFGISQFVVSEVPNWPWNS